MFGLGSRGLALPAYECPGCKGHDVIPQAMVTRPRPGQPWRQHKVGCLCQCIGCGIMFAATVYGVKRVGMQQPAASAVAPGEPDATQRVLAALTGDETIMSFRGV